MRIRTGARDLVVGPDRGAVVGRDAVADLQVVDSRVSRAHLTIRPEGDAWVVEDRGSTNGTFVDGRRITSLRVTAPTRLLLGDPVAGIPLDLEPVVVEAPAPVVVPAGGPALGWQPPPPPPPPPPPAPPALPLGAAAGGPPPGAGELGLLTGVRRLEAMVTIGRAADNDVVVDDLLVSRHHAVLRAVGGGFEIADLGSHNGVFVNGQRAVTSPLADGDVVSLGRRLFRLAGGTLEEYTATAEVSFVADRITVRTEDGRRLLDSVSFALERCSFLAVVGSSGAGKSTLLNALAGFRPAQEGRVLFGGRDLYTWYDEVRDRIGYVPQDDILHRQLTVRRALLYAAELRFPADVTPAERSRRVDEVLAELGLAHRADLPIAKLSGGQRKRVSIALELLTKPSLLFLDEPTSGLDPGYEKTLMRLLRELADGGRTVIVITHSLQSLTLCDRVLFLASGGRVAYFGPPDQALGYFGRSDIADVFSDLEQYRKHDWKGRFEASPFAERYVRNAMTRGLPARRAPGARPAPPHRHGWSRQVSTLVRRYLAVIASDRVNRTLIVVQAPVLSLILLLALSPGGFDRTPSTVSSAQLDALFLVTAMTFLGAANAIREIVKELPIYERERSVGLSISAYVASKVIVLAAITIFQGTILVLVSTARQGGDNGTGAVVPGPLRGELVVDVALAGVTAMGLGLVVSAAVRNVDKAITILPLLLVPLQILSNPLLKIDTKPVLSQLAPAALSQWGYGLVASTIDVNGLAGLANAVLPPGAEPVEQRSRWNHDTGTWWAEAAILALMFALEMGATWYLLRRRDPRVLGSPVQRPPASATRAAFPPAQRR